MTKDKPFIHSTSYIDDSAVVIGNVIIDRDCSVFPHAVLRGDQNRIHLQPGSNIQDGCVIHVDSDHEAYIGEQVSVGHLAMIHGATIEKNCIIGIHATILNGAVIKKGSIIGAHALVTSETVIPENSLVLGIPGKVVKQDPSYEEQAKKNAETYKKLSRAYKNNSYNYYKNK
jgi:carbonic anhydrase/acetyltransferase-like protein (isoleucine patch superfamily)